MTRGNGRDREFGNGEESRWRKLVAERTKVSLFDIEWVVVDEADVLVGAHAHMPSSECF